MKGNLIAGDQDDDDCCFKQKRGTETLDSIARVMDFERFVDYSDSRRPVYLEDLSAGLIYENEANLIIDSRAGYLFVTKAEEVEILLGDNPNESEWQNLLNNLGITNIGDLHGSVKNKYVLIRYPEDFAPARICQPSLIEGGEKPEFRIQSNSCSWGIAVNLDHSIFGEDGLPESIHCPYGIAKVKFQEFQLTPTPPPNYSDLCKIERRLYE